jgi:hypothetical protein
MFSTIMHCSQPTLMIINKSQLKSFIIAFVKPLKMRINHSKQKSTKVNHIQVMLIIINNI